MPHTANQVLFSLLSTLPLESGPNPNPNPNSNPTPTPTPNPSPNQVQFSLLSTLPLESGLFEACAELGVTPIGYSPLALGLLSDRYDETRLPKGPRGLLFKVILPGLQPNPAA